MKPKDIEKKLTRLLETAGLHEIVKSSGQTRLFAGDDGTLDSVNVLNLILAIEKEFGITVEDEEIQPKNFGSFADIVKYVEEKRKDF